MLLLISCTPVSKISVSNVNDNNTLQDASLLFALPQTIIDIEVTATETTIIPGPYAMFAEKYLGIKDVPLKQQTIWGISSVGLKHHIEADPDYLFVMINSPGEEDLKTVERLIKDSLILDLNSFTVNSTYSFSAPPEKESILFTDLSIKRNFDLESEGEISLLLPDTNYTASMATKNGITEKTPEQKAEEAANFLIKLRKRRFKLVSGQYDYMPQGEAMSSAIKELERIETEYLSLFIGKRISFARTARFSFTPSSVKESDQSVIFRFSENDGFHGARELSGKPAVLEIQSVNKLKGLRINTSSAKPASGVMAYRIPEQVNVKLSVGEQTWAEAVYPVFQQGVMIAVNLNMLRF